LQPILFSLASFSAKEIFSLYFIFSGENLATANPSLTNSKETFLSSAKTYLK